MSRLRRLPRIRSLAGDERGVSVIELAFYAPILSSVIIGIVDLAQAYSQRLLIQQAVHRALEKAAVGSVQSDYTYLKAEAATAAGVQQTAVTVDAWLECDQVRQPLFDGTCTSPAMTSRYVKLTVNGSYTPMFPYFLKTTNGKVALTASSSLRVQ
jgi:Flp pilus assembly protein TadG